MDNSDRPSNVKLAKSHHVALRMLAAATNLTQKQLLEEALYNLMREKEYKDALGDRYKDLIDQLNFEVTEGYKQAF